LSTNIRKCLDLAAAIEHPWQNLTTPEILYAVVASGTKWIRCWVGWDRMMPNGPGNSDPDPVYLDLIDDQIDTAKAHGINVILVTQAFPRWANGTTNVDPKTYAFADRNRAPAGEQPDLKPLEQGVPTGQLGVQGHWGQWIQWLVARYKPKQNVVLEIMNEPNLEWWPQLDGDGNVSSPCRAAEMMVTAAAIAQNYGMYIMAPALSDSRAAGGRLYTRYDSFLSSLRTQLTNLNFAGNDHFIWSQHNYIDTEQQSLAGYTAAYNTLATGNWWQGWKDPVGKPGIWFTEGGARLPKVGGNETTQASRVIDAYTSMKLAAGASMYTNYQLYSATNTDSGLWKRHDETPPVPKPADWPARPVWYKFLQMANNQQ
jgi:hypothetical protein